jgi:DNA-binding transcriptional MerR regulator
VTLSYVTTYRIDELAEAAAIALVAVGAVPPSARVSALPDRRMLRYYTTLGLLDRPLESRGRTAYYGRRHLLQIVAIKRLQAGGATLADVQARLAGATTADLERIADLPATDGVVSPPAPARREFWRAPPAPAPAPIPVAVRLGPSVTLVVDATRPLTDADHDALRAAAAPVLDHLTARGLLAAEPQER